MSGFQYAMLGVGGFAALCGALVLVGRIRTIVSGHVANGVVIDHKVETSIGQRGKLQKMYHAIYEFQHDGKTVRCTSSYGAKVGIAKGTAVRVRYLPSDPQTSAEIDAPLAMWGFPVGALAFAAIAVFVGLQGK